MGKHTMVPSYMVARSLGLAHILLKLRDTILQYHGKQYGAMVPNRLQAISWFLVVFYHDKSSILVDNY